MEESFLLKQYGHLTLMEQAGLTAEDRKWWLKKIDDENNRKNAQPAAPDTVAPTPGRPPA
jgi:gluconate kinase